MVQLLDEIAEKFYGVRRKNPLQGMGMFGEIFKVLVHFMQSFYLLSYLKSGASLLVY